MNNEYINSGVDKQGNKLPGNYNYKKKLAIVLDETAAEVLRAKQLFPLDFHNQHEAYAVILEEIDELWDEIKKNHKLYDLEAQRKEAKQAAAMLVRMMVELL